MKTVACLGSSSTAAKGPYDWIRDLELRPENSDLRFLRFAAGGDLSYNALQRMPKLLSSNPDYVVTLIGGNDVIDSMPSESQSIYYKVMLRLTKRLPRKPSPSWFKENMNTISTELESETRAKIALVSLPPWGENLESTDPYQAELNRLFAQYNGILKELATTYNVAYIPFYERMVELIRASPGKSMTGFKILPFYRDIFRQYVLRKSNDEIEEMNGRKFHRDGIHLNSVSGKLLANLVQDFLDRYGESQVKLDCR